MTNKQKPTVPAQKVLAGLIATRRAIARQGWTQDGFITDNRGEDVPPHKVFRVTNQRRK